MYGAKKGYTNNDTHISITFYFAFILLLLYFHFAFTLPKFCHDVIIAWPQHSYGLLIFFKEFYKYAADC